MRYGFSIAEVLNCEMVNSVESLTSSLLHVILVQYFRTGTAFVGDNLGNPV
jgi:hypothetical protein